MRDVGADDDSALATIGAAQCRRGGRACLADAALTRIEDDSHIALL